MATQKKHNKVTLKTKYEELKKLDKNRPTKEVAIQFNVPRSTLSTYSQPISTIVRWIDFFWIFWATPEVITDVDDENEDKASGEQVTHPWGNKVDEAIKALNRLSLFTENSGFDPLISKPTRIINQWRRDKCGNRR